MWLELQIFGFRALWSPYFMIYVVALGIAYFLITGPYRHKFDQLAEKPALKQQISFYIALLILYAVKGAPIDLLSHIMLSAHMIQMALLYVVFPILMLQGIPGWLWKKVLYKPFIKPIFKITTTPIVSLLLFNLLFSLYHLPAVFDFTKESQIAHSSATIIILFAAFVMWWPIVAPIKELDRIQPLLKIAYIIGGTVLITPACVLIIFANDPLYDAYTASGSWIQAMSLCVPGNVLQGLGPSISGPTMFSPISIRADQQLGGIIMKTVQEIVYMTMIARIFFKWFAQGSGTIDELPPNATQE